MERDTVEYERGRFCPRCFFIPSVGEGGLEGLFVKKRICMNIRFKVNIKYFSDLQVT